MAKTGLTQDQRDALTILFVELSDHLASIVAYHEAGCYLRAALDICLEMAGMDKGELLEVWAERVADGR